MKLLLFVGMLIMATRNHPLLGNIITNGTTGIIVGFDLNENEPHYSEALIQDLKVRILTRLPKIIYVKILQCDKQLLKGFPMELLEYHHCTDQSKSISQSDPDGKSLRISSRLFPLMLVHLKCSKGSHARRYHHYKTATTFSSDSTPDI